MTLPDFFIVGAPKCGTTALNHYLSQHPDLYLSPRKETHLFATDFRYSAKYPRPTLESYRSCFEGAQPHQRAGEASVFYLYSREAATNLKAFSPNASIIIMLRDPVELLHSLHSQYVATWDENLADFESALDAEERRKRQAGVEPHVGFAEMLYYRDVVRFAAQIERYFHAFGRDNVHVIIYDDLKRDAARVYRDTLRFLGVRDDFSPEFTVVNGNRRFRSRALGRLLHGRIPVMSASSRRLVRAVLPARVRHGGFQTLMRWNTQAATREPIQTDLRLTLQRDLRPEVERVSALLGIDLSGWCRA